MYLSSKHAIFSQCNTKCTALPHHSPLKQLQLPCTPATRNLFIRRSRCNARRRVRYEEDDEDEEEYGYNEEIAMLELYTQTARGEALLVRATVDAQEVQVLVFKGFSSSLSYGTASDLTKSVLPARAVIKTIDRIKGPFDPSNIEYIEQGLSWEAFRKRLPPLTTKEIDSSAI